MRKILSVILIVCSVLVLTGCGSKKEISISDFQKELEISDFTYEENSESISSASNGIVAISPDGWTIEFYEFENNDKAEQAFYQVRENTQVLKESMFGEKSSEGRNHNRYSLKSAGLYNHISRVGKTLIVAGGDSKDMVQIKEFLKKIKY